MATATKKGGSKIFWIIGGIVVIAGGIGAYFLLRKPKKENNNNSDDDTIVEKPVISSGGGNSTPKTPNTPKELNSKEKLKSFQDYVLDVKKDNTILGNAGADGEWGNNTSNAWNKYGSDYLNKDKSSNSDIQTIINSATGLKADASTLKSKNPDFVKKWAEKLKEGRSAFVWSNQVYDTKRGEKVLDYNPLSYTMYSKVFGKLLRKSPSTKSESSPLVKDQDLGKPSSVAYADGYVWFYLPKSNKWIASVNASRTKSSSFDGVTEEIEFLNFNNNLDLNI